MRPELGAQAASIEASNMRLKQERARPFIPSILLRGAATNPSGTLAGGVFGGGINDSLNDFAGRNSVDVQILWEMKNLGMGNVALVRERKAQRELAEQELVKTRYQVDAEVMQSRSRSLRAKARYGQAEQGLRYARESAEKNLQGLGQLRRSGEMVALVFRPQEAVQALQALSSAYNDFYLAVAERNRAQFQLYRALGNPSQAMEGPAEGTDRPEALPAPTPLAP
jgi:outer membrane protein TolC